MQELFYSLLDASFYGSIVILVIFALRLFLKNAPKNVLCLLWLLAALRLLVPFEIESRFSLQPDLDAVVQTQSGQLSETVTDTPIVTTPAAPPSAADTDLTPVIPTAPLQNDTSVPTTSETTLDLKAVLPWIWLAVATGLAIYSILSYFFLKRRVRSAVPLQPGVYECAGLHTAFVLGFLRPRIYLPAGLSGLEKRLVLAHERAHLRRGDHWWKLLGFLTAALHWFNPLVWVAYGVLCRDIEMACDARVIRSMDLAQRKAYSTALLNCSTDHWSMAACPVAFGEVSVKTRIKNVLNFRKPTFWITVVSAAAVLFVAVCFLTKPAQQRQSGLTDEQQQWLDQCKSALSEWQQEEICLQYSTEGDGSAYTLYRRGDDWLRISTPSENGYACDLLCINGLQYLDTYPYPKDDQAAVEGKFHIPDWSSMPAHSYQALPWLLTYDWATPEVTGIEHSGQITTVTLDRDPSDDGAKLTLCFYWQDGTLSKIVQDPGAEQGTGRTTFQILYFFEDTRTHFEQAVASVESPFPEDATYYDVFKYAFYSLFDADDLVCLADVTHDGVPEMLVVTVEENGPVYGYVYQFLSSDSIRLIWFKEGGSFHCDGYFAWYLRETEKGYDLVEETFDMGCGIGILTCEEYFLAGSSRVVIDTIYVSSDEDPDPNSGVGSVSEEAYDRYVQFLNEKLSSCAVIYRNESSGSVECPAVETDPAIVFAK